MRGETGRRRRARKTLSIYKVQNSPEWDKPLQKRHVCEDAPRPLDRFAAA
jgi:hypothetical protein